MILLPENEVHVWLVSLVGKREERFFPLLSQEERARAMRFWFLRDRRSYVIAHGVLRLILAEYLDRTPVGLQFSASRYGKPILTGGELYFNLSHSRDMVMVGVARREVGVDVEYLEPAHGGMEIARQFFSPQETAALEQLGDTSRLEAFFNCWSRKESFVKAKGEGLSLPLKNFDVSLAPGEPAALLADRTEGSGQLRWSIREVPVPQGYTGAVAAEGDAWRLVCRTWTDGQQRRQESVPPGI